MKLTIEKAQELLNNAKQIVKDDRWIRHSICVGNAGSVIAKALGLDPDYVKALGYVHDIGKIKCSPDNHFEWHDTEGYQYLLDQGIDEKDAMICLTHSYINGDYLCVAGGIPQKHPLRCEKLQNHDYSYEQKIINLCDLMCTVEVMTMEKRLIDLLTRKGFHSNTQYHLEGAQKLKDEFDLLLGHDVYLLFPEIVRIKEVYHNYYYDECGIHLSVDDKVYVSEEKAKERMRELNHEDGNNDGWSIRPMDLIY